MSRLVQWEQRIGRRVRLRDLFVFFTVVEYGSMAKAAAKLGVSTPSISEVIAALEHSLRVRLLDRTSKGVTMTPYGEALLSRGRAAFDELRQGIQDIEFIADPGSGELRIGCPESIAAGFLLPVMQRVTAGYPRVKFHVAHVRQPTVEFPELQERKVDLVLARLVREPSHGRLDEELNADVLFDDPYSLVVGAKSRWARRRRIDFADLVDEPWIIPPLDAIGAYHLADAYTARGMKAPNFVIATFSLHLRIDLVSSGQFITILPRSTLQIIGKRRSLAELPIKLPMPPTPVAIVTLRNRTLGPVADVFIRCARDVAESIAAEVR
jgi:DNA-binding transcriptional LysR family regulator